MMSITRVTVIDVSTGAKLADRTVVLQGDRILSVDPPDSAKPPQGRVIDAHGAFLIPGLWDMHVHIQDLEDLPLYIANGVAGVRMMFGVKKPNELRAKLATVTAPEVIIGSIILDGDPPVWPGSIVIHKPDDARRVVDEVKASGADFVEIGNAIPRDAYFAVVNEARKQNIPFAGYLPLRVRASEASEAGQRSIESLDGIDLGCSKREQDLMKGLRPGDRSGNMNLKVEAINTFDAAKCQSLFKQFRYTATWQVPTLTAHRSMAYLDDDHFTADPRLIYMSREVRRLWDEASDFSSRPPHEEFEFLRNLFRGDKQLVSNLFRSDVPLLAGTSATSAYCLPGFSLHDELALLVESGLTPLAALQAATIRPAEFLGRTADLGTVAPGKLADLVLLSADPLADIHNTTQIQAVWFRGKYFDRAALDALLEAAKHRHGKSQLH